MTIPKITKWRPSFFFYRSPVGARWQWGFYQHVDHNPTIYIQRWDGRWYFEFYGWHSRRAHN